MRIRTLVVTSAFIAACSGASLEEPTESARPTESADASARDSSAPAPHPVTTHDGGVKSKGQCDAKLTGRVSLPADDAVHTKEPMEWWYWTGHLQAEDGRWFGFEQVFFRLKILGAPGHMVHSAITDISGNKFHHFVNSGPGELPVKAFGYDFDIAGHTAIGSDGLDKIHSQGEGYSFDLELSSNKRPTYHHGDGYTDYSVGGYTYYYSRERMSTKGVLTLDGSKIPVTGTAWFDHQYGDILKLVTAGWDWFALQLDDGREIMLFIVHKNGQQEVIGASLTDADCVTTEVPPEELKVTPLGSWKSPHTNCTYPAGWDVNVKGMSFQVKPLVDDQEIPNSTPIYWEGASSVTGSAPGRAYVELTGYCPASPF